MSKHKIYSMQNFKKKQLDIYRRQGLPVDQLRTLLDNLYDGVPATMLYLAKIRAFYSKKDNIHREHQIYLWLSGNKLCGQKLVDFFEENDGFLGGLNLAVNRMDGRKYSLNTIKIDEAL